MLKCVYRKYYQVKDGQTLEQIAAYFCVSPRLLAKENGLKSQPFARQILVIPAERGNAYTVREKDTKALLCGSEYGFEKRNGTQVFYLGMSVRI